MIPKEFIMVKENQKVLNILNSIVDGLLIFLSYFIATYIRFDLMKGHPWELRLVWSQPYVVTAFFYAVVMVLVFHCANLYNNSRTRRIRKEIAIIFFLNFFGVVAFQAFLYWTRLADFTRIGFALFFLFSAGATCTKRACMRIATHQLRIRGYNLTHIAVVGNGHLARQFVKDVKKNPRLGLKVDGYVSREQRPGLGKCLGSYEDLERILAGPAIEEVVVALEPHEQQFMTTIIGACEKLGTKVSIIPYYNDYIPTNPTVDIIGESKLFNLRSIPLDNIGNAALKRAMDIVGSLILIILSSPFMLIAIIGVKLSSPGPAFFVQERVGRNKKNFKMLKFRSMRLNAESTTAWSKDVDPRKTRFGSFIRKFSIDELPQFFNVLKGDMSLVGPRPEIPFYVDQFKESIPLYMVKHQVRPGITGWAQVNGFRGDTSIEGRIKCDIWYIENWSLLLDLKIIFMTAFGGMVNKEKLADKADSKTE